MDTSDLVAAVAAQSGETAAVTKRVLAACVQVKQDAMRRGEDVEEYGLGKLSALKTPARKARNPATGASIDVPAGMRVKFKAAKALSDAVNRR